MIDTGHVAVARLQRDCIRNSVPSNRHLVADKSVALLLKDTGVHWKRHQAGSRVDRGAQGLRDIGKINFGLLFFTLLLWVSVALSARAIDWSTAAVDTYQVGKFSSIAVDSVGQVHISYYDSLNGTVKYASNPNGVWLSEVVAVAGHVNGGSLAVHTAIAVDSTRNPRIAFVDDNQRLLAYAERSGTSWTTQPVGTGDCRSPSLGIDSAGIPHVSYVANGDLRYATKLGPNWVTTTIEKIQGDKHTSLALDRADKPHVVYSGLSSELKYASQTGNGWATETVDGSSLMTHGSIALDSRGNPHISYHDFNKGTLNYAVKGGSHWNRTEVDRSPTSNVGRSSSIAVDQFDMPHISYYDVTAGDLKYAFKSDFSGEWVISVVDSGTVGETSDMVLDGFGRPHFSYFNADFSISFGLNYATDNRALRDVGSWPAFRRGIPSDVAVGDGFAYVTSETWGLLVFDLTNPILPKRIGDLRIPGALGSVLVGSHLFVAAGSGLVIVDLSTPSQPAIIGQYAVTGGAGDVAWARGFAYLRTAAGLEVLNVTDPTIPKQMGTVKLPTESLDNSRVALMGNFAYLTSPDGLEVVDVGNPSQIHQVGHLPTTGRAVDVAIFQDPAGSPSYLCVAANEQGMVLADLSDPAHPTAIPGVPTQGHVTGVTIRESTVHVVDSVAGVRIYRLPSAAGAAMVELADYRYSSTPRRVSIEGAYAYLLDQEGLRIVDVRLLPFPNVLWRPFLTGEINFGGSARSMALVGSIGYLADGREGLQVLDLNDPMDPVRIGVYNTKDFVWDVAVAGPLAYVAAGVEGMLVLDLSSPATPRLVGKYQTEALVDRVVVKGSFGYIAEGRERIVILDLSNPAAPKLISKIKSFSESFDVLSEPGGRQNVVFRHGQYVSLVDVTDPYNPLEVHGGLETASGIFRDIAVREGYVYAAADDGLWIWDVSDVICSSCTRYAPGTAFKHVRIAGSHAYAIGTDGLHILDLHDPSHPVRIGCHRGIVGDLLGLATSDSYLYLGTGWTGLRVYQLTGGCPPTIVRPPQSQNVCLGDRVTLSVTVDGALLSYEWRKEGDPAVLSTSEELRVASARLTDAGNYTVTIRSPCGVVSSEAALIQVFEEPRLRSQPTGSAGCVGDLIQFAVDSSGSNLKYEWRKEYHGQIQLLDTTTGPTLPYTIAQDDTDAQFSVRVFNSSCVEIMASLPLTVYQSPVVTALTAPTQLVCEGELIEFSVVATGAPPLVYQLLRDEVPIGSPTASSTLSYVVQPSDDRAKFKVRVSSSKCGSAESSQVMLAVKPVGRLTVSATHADCLRGKFWANLTLTAGIQLARAIVEDPKHYRIGWRDGNGGNGALNVAVVSSVPLANGSTDVTLSVSGTIPADPVAYTLSIEGFSGECGQSVSPVLVAVPCDPVLEGVVFRHQSDPANKQDSAAGEDGLLSKEVSVVNRGDSTKRFIGLTDRLGRYRISVPPGTYDVNLNPGNNWRLVYPSVGVAHQATVTFTQVQSGLDFAIQPVVSSHDMTVVVRAFAAHPDHTADTRRTPCPGQEAVLIINFQNSGTEVLLDGKIDLSIDSAFGRILEVIPPSECPVPGEGYFPRCLPWLNPGEGGEIRVRVQLGTGPVSRNIIAHAWEEDGHGILLADSNPSDNIAHLEVRTGCSYDPNSLAVSPIGCGSEGLVPMDTELVYTIQFHNLGDGPATDVVLRDQLPAVLDVTTARMIGSSHPYILKRTGNTLVWEMLNIKLPTDLVDELGSQGFVSFAVRPRTGVKPGAVVVNSAAVIFDLNSAIVTPKVTNTFTVSPMPVAVFSTSSWNIKEGDAVDFKYNGGTPGAAFAWDFGPGAVPPTSAEANPAGIIFASPGRHNISLRVQLGECEDYTAHTLSVTPESSCLLVVTNTADDGRGSLRQAVICANSHPGLDTISFAISGVGPHTITLSNALPAITDPVVIDGYTQLGASPNTLALGDNAVLKISLDGSRMAFPGDALTILSSNSVIRGLVISGFPAGKAAILIKSDGNVIEGNFMGTDTGGLRVKPNGTGIYIRGGNRNRIGSTSPAGRNIISGNSNAEQGSSGYGAQGIGIIENGMYNEVLGNYIGVAADGVTPAPNLQYGVLLLNSPNNEIGGSSPGAGNVISGGSLLPNDIEYRLSGIGVFLWGTSTTSNRVIGNRIGVDATGTVGVGNTHHGVLVLNAPGNRMEGNVISANGKDGIRIEGLVATNNSFLANSIFGNGALGISLNPSSEITSLPNDPRDADIGPNKLQNSPVLTSAVASGDAVILSGQLSTEPNTRYRLEFFANSSSDHLGYGAGELYLGSKDVTTADSGDTDFSVSFRVPSGMMFFAATATDSLGNTSELSPMAGWFRITSIQKDASGTTLTWAPTQPGKRYCVESKDSLSEPTWNRSGCVAGPTGTFKETTLPSTRKFYRVIEQ